MGPAAVAGGPAAAVAGFARALREGLARDQSGAVDGKGDLSHDAEIVCWDGTSRIPKVVAHYSGADMVLK